MKKDEPKELTREQQRVVDLLAADRITAADDRRRAGATVALENGDTTAAADATLGPTPEQLAKGEYRRVATGKHDGTARVIVAHRRVTEPPILRLHRDGEIDDDMAAACAWYRKTWEQGGTEPASGVAQYEPSITGGDKAYGHMPRSVAQAEARADLAWARKGMPVGDVALLDAVVIEELPLSAARAVARCRFNAVAPAFRIACLALHGVVAHLLPIEQKNAD